MNADKVYLVGFMGAGSTLANVLLFLSVFERVLRASGYEAPPAKAALAAAEAAAK